MDFLKKHWLPISLFILTFALYLYTLGPNWAAVSIFNTWDGLEYVLASYLLGIDHPPGHPLYLILVKLFTLIIPIGGIAFRVNLFSAFFGALTAVALFLSIELALKMIRPGEEQYDNYLRKAVAASSTLIFAFSFVFWSHAVIPEVHTFYLFLVSLVIYFTLRWRDTKSFNGIYLVSLFLGFSISTSILNALTVVLPTVIFILVLERLERAPGVRWLTLFFLFVIPLTLYLYYPLRARSADFVQSMNFYSPYLFGSLPWLFWYVSGGAWTGAGMFNPLRVFSGISNYLVQLNANLTLFSILLALMGLTFGIKEIIVYFISERKRKAPIKDILRSAPEGLKTCLFLLFLYVIVVLPQLSIKDPSNPVSSDIYLANFYLPSFLILVFFIGLGTLKAVDYLLSTRLPQGILRFFGESIENLSEKQKRMWFLSLVCILLIIPTYLLAVNYPKCNLREKGEERYRYIKEGASEIPKGSLIFSKLVYQLVGIYFDRIDPVLKGKNILIVSPDAPSFRFPGGDLLARFLKTTRLKKVIKEYQEKGVPVYLAGDAVEEDKAPEGLLLADCDLNPVLPTRLPSAGEEPFPRELLLYKVGDFRKAELVKKAPEGLNKGVANQGDFAGVFKLLGFTTPEVVGAERGRGKMVMDFYWEVLSPYKEDLLGVLLVIDEKFRKVAPERTAWFYTLGGEKGTSQWEKGKVVKDRVYYYLPSLPFGRYYLALGLMKLSGETVPFLPAGEKAKRAFDFVLLMPFGVGVPLATGPFPIGK